MHAEALAVQEDLAWRHMKAIPHVVKAHIPAASPLGGKGTGRTSAVSLPAMGTLTWLFYTGKERADNEQEAENHVYFCSKA